ncbi:MAG: nucleotide exchange factor GrpE [Candidatus Doudnabacteria bacterium]|nr:nucleotide exchange factor GrpE [Candidatus Doudnabacteria bacterium]
MSDEQISSPEDQIAQLEAKIEELTNNWKRTAADFDNYRKRKDAEGPEMMQFAKELTVSKLMPSLQNLEQVLKYAPEDEKYKDWLSGLRGTIIQLERDMEDLGVKKIKAVGELFDPEKHEAVEEVEGEAGKIMKEVQPGFMLNNKVIIPAKVAVGKSSE